MADLQRNEKAGADPAVVDEYAYAMPSRRWYGRPLLPEVDQGLGCSAKGFPLRAGCDPGVVDVGGGRASRISTDRFVWPNACSEVRRDKNSTSPATGQMRASAWVVDGGVGARPAVSGDTDPDRRRSRRLRR